MTFYKGIVFYEGTNYQGWQSQKNKLAVQDIIEKTFFKIWKIDQKIEGASRTDSGVHAYGQVVKFKSPINSVDLKYLKKIINENLPKDIFLREIDFCSEDFSPRFDAKKKLYNYFISSEKQNPIKSKFIHWYKYKYDFDIFNESLSKFIGTHDFTAYSTGSKEKNAIRTIYKCESKKINEEIVVISIEGNGFLKYMVRRMIAAAITIATKGYKIGTINEYLENKNCCNHLYNMPPEGLILSEIAYEQDKILKDFVL
jgi:tRNA pseudouridine38-40 synthase